MLTLYSIKKVKYFMLTNIFFYKDLIFFILDIYKCPFINNITLYRKTFSKKSRYQHYADKNIFRGIKLPYHNFFYKKSAKFISIQYL